MEFFEFVLIFSMLFVLPLSILKAVLDYKKAKGRGRVSEGAPSGVTAGELRALLREAVEEANAPLLARIDELEERVRPADSLDAGLLGEDEPYAGTEQDRTLGRRVSE